MPDLIKPQIGNKSVNLRFGFSQSLDKFEYFFLINIKYFVTSLLIFHILELERDLVKLLML